jgi:peptidoglycan/LPS O-acetylase OafA/YrhL
MRARTGPHWQGLDGLRALAVIAVVIYHFSPSTLPGGFLGVDIFFVISGYLITRLLCQEFLAAGRIDIRRFYLRRARRLLPALALLLVAVSVAALVWRDQLATVRGGVISAAFFSGNWWLAFDHQSYFVSTGRPSMLQHLWSLGVEEQFYLLWPVVAAATLAASRRAGARRGSSPGRVVTRLSLIAVALSLGSTGLTWLLADLHNVPFGNDGSTLYYGTDTHCMGLLLGAAFGAWSAVAVPAAPSSGVPESSTGGPARPFNLSPMWWERGVEGCGVAALVVLALLTRDLASYSHTLYRGDFLLVSVLVVIVIAVATRPASLLGKVLDSPPLRWIGVRSYSIYLWHWPIALVTRPGIDTTMPLWLDQFLRISLTVALSDVTYRYVETPVRRLGIRAALAGVIERVRTQWRALPPRLGVAGPVGLAALAFVGAVVIVVGPAAPKPSAAVGASPGGRHLVLTPGAHPSPTTTGGTEPVDNGPRLPKLSGFGDSVLLGARHALSAEFPGGTVDAVEGRQPDPILADARAAARDGTLHPLVVIHLGNNGLIQPSDLEATLRALSGVRLVLILNDHLDPTDQQWQKPNNATISRVAPLFANVRIVDWDRLAGTHRDWLYPDDLHLRPVGAVAYAELIAAEYRADVPGPGGQLATP